MGKTSAQPEAAAGAAADVSVRLLCIYAGAADIGNPGDVITVPSDEADRLVDLGAATREA
jgi:hypothetical protein